MLFERLNLAKLLGISGCLLSRVVILTSSLKAHRLCSDLNKSGFGLRI